MQLVSLQPVSFSNPPVSCGRWDWRDMRSENERRCSVRWKSASASSSLPLGGDQQMDRKINNLSTGETVATHCAEILRAELAKSVLDLLKKRGLSTSLNVLNLKHM